MCINKNCDNQLQTKYKGYQFIRWVKKKFCVPKRWWKKSWNTRNLFAEPLGTVFLFCGINLKMSRIKLLITLLVIDVSIPMENLETILNFSAFKVLIHWIVFGNCRCILDDIEQNSLYRYSCNNYKNSSLRKVYRTSKFEK